MKTPNCRARQKVMNRTEFTGNNTFGVWTKSNYVVYSYGLHFPLLAYIYAEEKWYHNTDKYSTTTSKHMTQLRPLCETSPANTKQLNTLINNA